MAKKIKIITVVGARPNFMKAAALVKAFAKKRNVKHMLVHTGQHYDKKMSEVFFGELGLPEPDVNLNVKSGSHAQQTAKIMQKFEKVCVNEKPDCVIVVGDVNSTIACGLTAVKLGIKLAHVEAGLRSGDRSMPEEINRIAVDAISDLLFVTEPSGAKNLKREGVPAEKIYYVGNTMIDTLLSNKTKANKATILKELGLKKRKYVVLTMHRPSNVDDLNSLVSMIESVKEGCGELPIVFPIHPRTKKQLEKAKADLSAFICVEPLGYLDFLKLMMDARLVMTDSGGIQEETSVLGVPCITMRKNTERPVTIKKGTNKLVGTNPEKIRKAAGKALAANFPAKPAIEKWDGKAGHRIAAQLLSSFCV